jgi:hypothetical protein
MKKSIVVLVCIVLVLSAASTVWAKHMEPEAFKNKAFVFTDRVLDGKQFDFLAAKKELIEDLYRTEYAEDFYNKYDWVVRSSRSLSFAIEGRLSACKSEEEFKAVKSRYAEWKDFCLMADRAPEDYQKGVIQEHLMDKGRDGKPPFKIASVKWEPAQEKDANPDIEAYKKELSEAEKVLKKVLAALKNKNENEFAQYFPEKLQLLRKAEPEKSEINRIFKSELSDNWKEGMSTDLAPMFIRGDLKDAGRDYKNGKFVKVVLRRWKSKEEAKVSAVFLVKDGNKYVIKKWKKGSFDMMNRKR